MKAQIQKTAQDASLQGLVFAPGCVITVDTPQENIAAVANAVRSLDPFEFE
ncbi:MAG: hypothetical protein ACW99U_18485 [Candidatus Thorarchaeota archaeon]